MSMSYSFTKKGTGRKHDYSGVLRKIQSGMTFQQQYLIRRKYGAVTEMFWRRYKRHMNIVGQDSNEVSIYRKLRNFFIKLAAKK